MKFWKIISLIIIGGIIQLSPLKNDTKKAEIDQLPLQQSPSENIVINVKYQGVAILNTINHIVTHTEFDVKLNKLDFKFLNHITLGISVIKLNLSYQGIDSILTNFPVRTIIYPFHSFL